MLQEMSQWVVFVKENSRNKFYSKAETFFDPLVIVGSVFKIGNWSKLCTENVNIEQKNSWSAHVTFD